MEPINGCRKRKRSLKGNISDLSLLYTMSHICEYNDTFTIIEVVKINSCTRSFLYKRIKVLEELGLVVRVKQKKHKSGYVFYLTQKGREMGQCCRDLAEYGVLRENENEQ